MSPFAASPLRTLSIGLMLCIALAGAMAVEVSSATGGGEAAPDALPAPPASGAAQPKTRFTLAPLSSFAEIAERPLFSPSRRPIAANMPQNADQRLDAALAGIVISETSRSVIVTHGDPPVVTRLKEGDAIDGWTVHAIEPGRVTLRRGADEQDIKLRDVPGQAADAAAPSRPRR